MTRTKTTAILFLFLLGLPGCDQQRKDETKTQPIVAAPIGLAECAACGMVVKEQPAPRVQVLHRDGKRVQLCSMEDALHYLADKNSHGKPAAVFVEALPEDASPGILDSREHPWSLAGELSYVTDIERPGVMGAAVMSFRNHDTAQALAEKYGGQLKDWKALSSPPLQ